MIKILIFDFGWFDCYEGVFLRFLIRINFFTVPFKNYVNELVVKNSFPLPTYCKPALQGFLDEWRKI